MNFHHHPDGLIFLRQGDKVYCDTVANFSEDLGEEYYNLPSPYIERYYEPSRCHWLKTSNSSISLPLTWPTGDEYLAKIDELLATQQSRQQESPEPQSLSIKKNIIAKG